MMKIEFLEVIEPKSFRRKHPFEIISLIENKKICYRKLLQYKGIEFEKIVEGINKCVENEFGENSYINARVYIVPWDIESKYREGLCDGFSYKGSIYCAVIAIDTDVMPVIIHELCHIIIREKNYKSGKYDIDFIENLVEEIEKSWYAKIMKGNFERVGKNE